MKQLGLFLLLWPTLTVLLLHIFGWFHRLIKTNIENDKTLRHLSTSVDIWAGTYVAIISVMAFGASLLIASLV